MHEPSVTELVSFNRVSGLLEYVRARQTPIRWPELTDRFGVSRATAFRYLRALRELGEIDHEDRPLRRTVTRSSVPEHC